MKKGIKVIDKGVYGRSTRVFSPIRKLRIVKRIRIFPADPYFIKDDIHKSTSFVIIGGLYWEKYFD